MVEIEPLTPSDLAPVVRLWADLEGLTLRDADSPAALARYLTRNPGLSFVARSEGDIVAAVICGHDGRRGYLHHLAVHPDHRRRGLGRRLAERCLAALLEEDIEKCHLFVRSENERARAFWRSLGWTERDDIVTLSKNQSSSANA